MLADPFVLPHADGNISCVKINNDAYSSEYSYRSATQQVRIKARHSQTKGTADSPAKDRHNVEVVQTIFAAGEAAEYSRKAYIVIEQLPGDTDVKLVDALADWLIASANANVGKLLNWES